MHASGKHLLMYAVTTFTLLPNLQQSLTKEALLLQTDSQPTQ